MMPLLILMIGTIVAFLVWTQIAQHVVAPRLEAEMGCRTPSVAFGRTTDLTIVIRNPTWFPCPVVKGTLELPEGLVLSSGDSQTSHGVAASVDAVSRRRYWPSDRRDIEFPFGLRAKESLTVHLTLQGTRRGRQRVQGLKLRISDGFTPTRLTRVFPDVVTITVHPQRIRSRRPVVAAIPTGLLTSVRKLSPTSLDWIDLHEYALGDSVRDVAWMPSARHGQLLVLERATSINQDVILVTCVQVSDRSWEGHPKDADRVYETAYGIIEALSREGLRFRLYCDGFWEHHRVAGIRNHLVLHGDGVWNSRLANHIGHALGVVSAYPATPVRMLLAEIRRASPPMTPILIITTYESQEIRREVKILRHLGHFIDIVQPSELSSQVSAP